VDGSDTWFLWSGDRLLEERDDTGALAVRYTYGVGYAPVQLRIADGVSGEDVYDVHSDHLDTPRRLTDASGVEVWEAEIAAFGEAFADPDPDGDLTEIELHVRFPGQYLDEETGLHYNRFRYYDPAVGRYISADPIEQWGGANRYNYAGVATWPAPLFRGHLFGRSIRQRGSTWEVRRRRPPATRRSRT
jgi:RHS repeat-associated protein